MIKENLQKLLTQINPGVSLIAVSKKKAIPHLLEAYEFGIRDFGENYVQELCDKQKDMPTDIRWHMIGHLQTNKVKFIVPFIYLIHSVDSLKLLKEINKEAAKVYRKIKCLLQVHIAKEDTKTGFYKQEILDLVADNTMAKLTNVEIVGLMGMSTFTDDTSTVTAEFKLLKEIFDQLNIRLDKRLEVLSMGMSGDWQLAIENGSNMVRIGSAIFGERV